MEKTINALSNLQLESFKKGVNFKFDLNYDKETSISTARVGVSYTSIGTGDIEKAYVFNASITSDQNEDEKEVILNEIELFIDSIRL